MIILKYGWGIVAVSGRIQLTPCFYRIPEYQPSQELKSLYAAVSEGTDIIA
jgi:hypothetical protein